MNTVKKLPLAMAVVAALCPISVMAQEFTQEQIDGLHLPIGVAIEAEDPEEIAISIAAEMIHLRRTKLVPRKR